MGFSSLPAFVNIPQSNSSADELCSKLFDEVDKVKSWKVKVETETVEKERKLQDNKRTIESQRKAIQELQVCILEIAVFHCLVSIASTHSEIEYICLLLVYVGVSLALKPINKLCFFFTVWQ